MFVGQQASGEVLDWRIDWTAWLNGDTISTSSWTVTSGVTMGSSSHTTTTATLFISGGTIGRTYILTNTIVTAGGRTAKRSISVVFVERKTE